MVDLVKEFRKILIDKESLSSKCLIIKKTNGMKCSCFDEGSNSGNPTCPVCLGTGQIFRVLEEEGYLTKSSSPSLRPKLSEKELFANTSKDGKIVYFLDSVDISPGDYLVIANKNNFIDSKSGIFEVDGVDKPTAENAEKVFTLANLYRQPINERVSIKNISLASGYAVLEG